MDLYILFVFALVYLGMILGEIPGLKLDRSGVALLGAIALLAAGKVTPEAAWLAVDVPTMGLLLGLMIVSAQFRLGGFYAWVTRRLAEAPLAPRGLLLALMLTAGGLSAVLANDIVCLAMAPILVTGCVGRKLDPVPFLLGLAASANIGSAATLIGNPQNILIGAKLGMSFTGYLGDALLPAAGGVLLAWIILVWQQRGAWEKESALHVEQAAPALPAPDFNAYQTGKGAAVTIALMALFLFSPWPREVIALGAAGVLLLSRRLASRHMLGLVDWQLLVLFAGLFVVNHALAASGMLEQGMNHLRGAGLHMENPVTLFVSSVVLSNIVSNVPATMLLLPSAGSEPGGAILALSSTLAGNLLIVGSIANIIVVDAAAGMGVSIGWKRHARAGIPITLATLALAAAWLGIKRGIWG